MKPGDQEGRMTHKPPSKSLYDTAYKERWFKLKGNFLFYYRLNAEGRVEKNEPNGVFILENVTVERDQEDLKCCFGFTITWKDDPFRKHGFYTSSENILQMWIEKLIHASYEVLRAKLLVLRLKIKQKSGKDPLEHLGTPLPICSLRGMLVSPSKATSAFLNHGVSMSSLDVSKPAIPLKPSQPGSCPTTPSMCLKFVETEPIPPPRTKGSHRKSKTYVVTDRDSARKVGPSEVTFRSHINANSNLEKVVTQNSSQVFKSHVKGQLSKEEIEAFLK